MVKYLSVATGLKLFSCCRPMRRLYRTLGNQYGARKRVKGQIREFYVERVRETLELARTHGIVGDGARIFELGTGWLHWEAITMSLFFDVEAVLFDVWDNRQLAGMKNYLQQLRGRMGEFQDLVSPSRLAEARKRIDTAIAARTFEEIYERFHFQYVADSSGRLTAFPSNSFDYVVSRGVLEHVDREAALPLMGDTYRILKPGGWALHGINIGDHLSVYDHGAHRKLYLSFPEWLWRIIGQNQVQYINRLQRDEWISIFDSLGFVTVVEDGSEVKLDGLRLARRYQGMRKEDLQRTILRVLLRKAGRQQSDMLLEPAQRAAGDHGGLYSGAGFQAS